MKRRQLSLERLETRQLLAGRMLINEFTAANDSTLLDEDGDSSDWIELINDGDQPVDLQDWSLTDDPGQLAKWRFPSIIVEPGQYLTVFASGKDRAIAGEPLHASFQLDRGGEYLALVSADGQTLQDELAPEFPRQAEDLSYGRLQQVSKLVGRGAAARVRIPTDSGEEQIWTANDFDDSAWQGATLGVGFETGQLQSTVTAYGTLPGAVGSQEYGGALGMDFVVNQTISITSLGVFDSGADGLNRSLTAQIWTRSGNSGTLLASLLFTPASPGQLINSDRFKPLAEPLNLPEGDYTVVAYGYGAGEPNGNVNGPSFDLRTTDDGNGAITFVGQARYGAAGGFPPTVDTGPANRYSAGTFQFSAAAYANLIETDLSAAMHNLNASAYIRTEFNVDLPSSYSSMLLRMKYDDGFVAYLNGVEIARRNAPAQLAWNASADQERPLEQSLEFEDMNVSASLPQLVAGVNALSIHGLNRAADDGDFLVAPELLAGTSPGDFTYLGQPTPGKPNAGETAFAGFVSGVSFSEQRGIFDSPISLRLTSSTPAAQIRYTTDGSEPSLLNGQIYSLPLNISSTTVVRAAAFKNGYRSSESQSHTYVFLPDVDTQPRNPVGYPTTWNGVTADYEMDSFVTQNPLYHEQMAAALTSLPTMSLVLNVDDMFGPSGIYANPTQHGPTWERPVSVEFFDPNTGEQFHINAGIRVHGGASRVPSESMKKSFRLYFRDEYGDSKLDYPFFPGSNVEQFDKLILRANFGDAFTVPREHPKDSSFVRDQWVRDTQLLMGHPSPEGRFVHLYINGLYWGMYNPVERPDEDFASEHLGGDDWDVVKPGETVSGDRDAWNSMMALANQGLADPARYQAIQEYLDVENLIDYMTLNIYAYNQDWFGGTKNLYAIRPRVAGGQYKFVAWDSEHVFSIIGINRPLDLDISDVNAANSPSQLYSQLQANAEFRILFADHVQRHLFNDGSLTPDAVTQRWLELAETVELATIPESARWGDSRAPYRSPLIPTPSPLWTSPLTQADVLAEQNRLLTQVFPTRTAVAIQQFRNRGLYPNVNAPQFSQRGGVIAPGFSLTIQAAPGQIYYTLDGSDPRLEGGAVSPAAIAYADGITLNDTRLVRARILQNGQWSALDEAQFFTSTPAAAGNLTISEIHYNPQPPTVAELAIDPTLNNDDFEFLELQNTSSGAIDLSGVQFTRGIVFSFGENAGTLLPGERLVLVENQIAFETRYGQNAPVAGVFEAGGLSNSGEGITLVDYAGAPILEFSYDDEGGWPNRADGKGSSLELIDTALDPADDSSWRSSSEYGGSPGAAGLGPRADVRINEVLTHTDPPRLDALELYNTTNAPVDISGWVISDSAENFSKFVIPAGTILDADGYLVFDESDFNASGGLGPNDFAFDGAHGDDAWLLETDSSGRLTSFVDHVQFGAAANGESIARWPNGQGPLYPSQTASLGSRNTGPRVGPVIISEVMYNPSGDEALEFVEIHNPTGGNVDLSGWRVAGGVEYEFLLGQSLGAGETIVLTSFDPFSPLDAGKLSDFQTTYGVAAQTRLFGPYSGRLDNGGEEIRLVRPDDPPLDEPDFVPQLLEDQVLYDDDSPWPVEADGGGVSLQRLDPSLWGNSFLSWRAAVPTPGQTSFQPFTVASVEINADTIDPPDRAAGPQTSSWRTQNSDLRTIRVTFNKQIRLNVEDVALTNLGVNAAADPDISIAISSANVEVQGNSLVIYLQPQDAGDGVYQLDLRSTITDSAGNALDGNGDGIAGDDYRLVGSAANGFYALAGEFNGDGGVTIFDFPTFSYWFGSAAAPAYVDLNADGGVTIFDFPIFAANFGQSVRFPAELSSLSAMSLWTEAESARLPTERGRPAADSAPASPVDEAVRQLVWEYERPLSDRPAWGFGGQKLVRRENLASILAEITEESAKLWH